MDVSERIAENHGGIGLVVAIVHFPGQELAGCGFAGARGPGQPVYFARCSRFRGDVGTATKIHMYSLLSIKRHGGETYSNNRHGGNFLRKLHKTKTYQFVHFTGFSIFQAASACQISEMLPHSKPYNK